MTRLRQSRAALVASVMSLVLIGLVLCPCPAMFTAAAEPDGSHDCCAGGEGLSASSDSCCASHDAGRPRALDTAPPAPSVLPVVSFCALALSPVVDVVAAQVSSTRAALAPPLVLRV